MLYNELSFNGYDINLLKEHGMSLGIVFKGPDGIVLATDSRLLRVKKQTHVGTVMHGLGALGFAQAEMRTAHSFLPEFEATLATKHEEKRLSVEAFAKELSDFFMGQWRMKMPKDYNGDPMIFLIGGYDENAPYGRVFQVAIPNDPQPVELTAGPGAFGVIWGGQTEIAARLLAGFDPRLLAIVQQWNMDIRGVGGAMDVATITRAEGFMDIQEEKIRGDVVTQTIPAHIQKKQGRSRETVINSLERSIKENADVWAELSKH